MRQLASGRSTALRGAGAPITAVDVLPDPQIRQELQAISGWPTIPQVFVKGELIGGADITEELAASGELEQKLSDALGENYRGAAVQKHSNSSSVGETSGFPHEPLPFRSASRAGSSYAAAKPRLCGGGSRGADRP